MNLPDLRRKLDRLNKQILSRLADRSRLAHSPLVYQNGGIPVAGDAASSFFEHALRGLESYHATLGRYRYPDQNPMHSDLQTDAPVQRIVSIELLPDVHFPLQDQLIGYYISVLPELTPSGDDPQSYGETAFIDSDCLMLIHERINLGRYVAQVKARQSPEILKLRGTPDRLRAALIDATREAAVIANVRLGAERLELDAELIGRLFRWIIERTLDVEVYYLQHLPAN